MIKGWLHTPTSLGGFGYIDNFDRSNKFYCLLIEPDNDKFNIDRKIRLKGLARLMFDEGFGNYI